MKFITEEQSRRITPVLQRKSPQLIEPSRSASFGERESNEVEDGFTKRSNSLYDATRRGLKGGRRTTQVLLELGADPTLNDHRTLKPMRE